MYQSDWLLRQIEMMGDAFRRLLAALREHRPDDALEVSREAIGELLETDPGVVDMLGPEGLVTLLSAGGSLDVFRAHMLGELLAARAAAQDELGHAGAAAADRHRARVLLEATLPLAEGADADRIAEVLGWLGE
ncbi:MAG: hypothetical protein JXP72_01620 [Coriobacteriia bacterium]|nr:hypothetical protein [Coriobacteriia bacterium]